METFAVQKRSRLARDERRASIVDVASEVFLSEGYAAASMSEIAARVGGSKATLYNYFPSKEELFAAVVTARCEQLQSIIADVESEGVDLRTSLKHLGERFLALILTDDAIATFRLVVAESARFPEIGRAFYAAGPRAGEERIGRFLSQGIAHGELRTGDPIEMARAFVDLCKTDIQMLRLCNAMPEPSSADIAHRVDRAADQFLAIYATKR
jgi:TetR/AcrR family transcriptional repressor of mexJK operon